MVYNRGIERIVEEDGKLIQKIYPIFLIPESDHFLDLRTQFLVAYKPIFGGYLGTFVFNLLVIWTMSALLIVMLFFDVLGRLMQR